MLAVNAQFSGMKIKSQMGAFTLYTHLSWTGRFVLGTNGARFDADALNICPELNLGCVGILFNSDTGLVIDVYADQGKHEHVTPNLSQRLLFITTSPFVFPAKTLEAISRAVKGENDLSELSEVEASNAKYFLTKVREMGIEFSTSTITGPEIA